jgi:hypothetical protein
MPSSPIGRRGSEKNDESGGGGAGGRDRVRSACVASLEGEPDDEMSSLSLLDADDPWHGDIGAESGDAGKFENPADSAGI